MISAVTQSRLSYVQSEIQRAQEEVRRFTEYLHAAAEGESEQRELCRADAMRHLYHARKTLEKLVEHR